MSLAVQLVTSKLAALEVGCPRCDQVLRARFVDTECPRCGYPAFRGAHAEFCSATTTAGELRSRGRLRVLRRHLMTVHRLDRTDAGGVALRIVAGGGCSVEH